MTPNLAKLFDLANSSMAGPDEFKAQVKLEKLMRIHGETILAALEGVLDHKNHGGFTIARERATQLLAQLEAEARP